MNAALSGLKKDELYSLCTPRDGFGIEEWVDGVWKTRMEVLSYFGFRNTVNLGISISLNDIPFERAMVFSWIKGEIDGRKN